MGTSSKLYTLNNAIFCLDKGVHFNLADRILNVLKDLEHFFKKSTR